MFSTFTVSFATIYAVQTVAALSLLATQTATLSLHIFERHGSVKLPIYLLLAGNVFGTAAIFIMVARDHGLLSSPYAKSASSVFTYLYVASYAQWVIGLLRMSYKSRFETEKRLITNISSSSIILSVTILIAAIGSYFAQQYMAMDLQFSMEKILFSGLTIINFCPLTIMMVAKYSYRNLTPKKKEIIQPFSKRLRGFGYFIAVLVANEVHGVILLSYPPNNWKDMFGILGVAFVIGTVFYQVVACNIPFLQEPTYEYLTSEKQTLEGGGNN